MSDPAFSRRTHPIGENRLRPLGADECAQLADALAMLDPWRTLGFRGDALAQYLAREDLSLRRFVLERGGMVSGLMAIRAPWLRGPYIELLAVLPGAQSAGLGRLMVEWAAAEAAAVSSNLWACVSAFNESARAFYNRLGFVEVAMLPDLVTPGFDEILLRRRV